MKIVGFEEDWKNRSVHHLSDFTSEPDTTLGPVGSVFAAYSPRCDVHRGVHAQILPTRGKILLRSENALHLRRAFLTEP